MMLKQQEFEKLIWAFLSKYLEGSAPDEVFSEYDEASPEERDRMLSAISFVSSMLGSLSAGSR